MVCPVVADVIGMVCPVVTDVVGTATTVAAGLGFTCVGNTGGDGDRSLNSLFSGDRGRDLRRPANAAYR